jgi:glycosyltransferase involved in cell wall biosynthesis
LTGGHIAVVEIANRLAERGHEVDLIYPRRSVLSHRNDILRSAERLVRLRLPDRLWQRNASTLDWAMFTGRIVEVEDLDTQPSERYDVVVATAWRTAEAVATWRDRTRTIYFLQHYETWSGNAKSVDATWRLPFELVASSEWLRMLARDKFARRDVEVIPYGVDLEIFRPVERTVGERPRVGFLYHVEDWKGVGDTLTAVEIVRRERDLDLVAFGAFENRGDLPLQTEFHLRPKRSELPALYSSLDVFVCGSWSETGPMTVPEAMACRTPVVATDVGNVRLWTDGGKLAWIVPPRRPDLLARQLTNALDNPEERGRRATAGLQAISSFTWDRTADAFAAVLEKS